MLEVGSAKSTMDILVKLSQFVDSVDSCCDSL